MMLEYCYCIVTTVAVVGTGLATVASCCCHLLLSVILQLLFAGAISPVGAVAPWHCCCHAFLRILVNVGAVSAIWSFIRRVKLINE